MRLSPRFCVADWNALEFAAEEDWQKAVDIVEDRIEGRFVRWIDRLIGSEFAGFACLSLDCLLIETLYGFQNGAATRNTPAVYKSMLTAAPFSFDDALAEAFYDCVRNGIIHDTETRRGWLIRMTPQTRVIEKDSDGNHSVNRTMFHEAVKAAFTGWIAKVRAGDPVLRDKMRQRMDEIIRNHYAS